MKGKKWFKFVSSILVVMLIVSTNAGAIFAAESTLPNEVYGENGIQVEVTKLNSTDSIIDFEDNNGGEDYTIYAYGAGTGEYYSETYDQEGNFLNKVIQDGNDFIVYDINGNILAESTLSDSDVANLVGQKENGISPMAYTWVGDPVWSEGSTHIYQFLESTVTSLLAAVIAGVFGIPSGTIAYAIVKRIAKKVVDGAFPIVYYAGWKQYGWDTGFSIMQVDIFFYSGPNQTGYIDDYYAIVPNH